MGSKGLVGHAGECADPGGGGGGGGGGGEDLDLNPLIPLTKFPGSPWGGGVQFISLECIRTDCLMEYQAQG